MGDTLWLSNPSSIGTLSDVSLIVDGGGTVFGIGAPSIVKSLGSYDIYSGDYYQ